MWAGLSQSSGAPYQGSVLDTSVVKSAGIVYVLTNNIVVWGGLGNTGINFRGLSAQWAIWWGSCSNKHDMRDWCSSHCTLLLPNTSCGKPPAGPSTENPRNTQETSVCRSNKGGDLFAKHRGRRRGGRGRGERSEEAWVGVGEVLPHLKAPGGPL